MNYTHLTEETLQTYLVKEIQEDTIIAHLVECSNCRERVEEYQFLFDSMRKISTETLSFDVSTLVMSNIMLYEKKKSKRKELASWGLLLFLVITIASFSIPFIPKVLPIFSLKFNLATLLLIGTGLGVLLFLLTDCIRQYKAKEDEIFKNNLQPIL
jgi:hypothetical protein